MVEDLSHWRRWQQYLDEMPWDQSSTAWRDATEPGLDLLRRASIAPQRAADCLRSWQAVIDGQAQLARDLQQLRRAVEDHIAQGQAHYQAISQDLWLHGMQHDTAAETLGRAQNLTPELAQEVLGRVRRWSDWHWPGAVLRPGTRFGLDLMVAMDPLYLVDTSQELLAPALSGFREEYQRRLRPVVVPRLASPPPREGLPPNQLGLILAWEFFNYMPQSQTLAWLGQLLDRLRPGGCLMFTINDCERWGAIDLVERRFHCWSTASAVRDAALNMGYEVAYQWAMDPARTWFELVRPGSTTSLRGGQSLALINPLPGFVDTPPQTQYNDPKHQKILQRARELGIDINLPLDQLRRIIKERKQQ